MTPPIHVDEKGAQNLLIISSIWFSWDFKMQFGLVKNLRWDRGLQIIFRWNVGSKECPPPISVLAGIPAFIHGIQYNPSLGRMLSIYPVAGKMLLSFNASLETWEKIFRIVLNCSHFCIYENKFIHHPAWRHSFVFVYELKWQCIFQHFFHP